MINRESVRVLWCVFFFDKIVSDIKTQKNGKSGSVCDGDRSNGGVCGGDGVNSSLREEIEAMGKSNIDIEGI